MTSITEHLSAAGDLRRHAPLLVVGVAAGVIGALYLATLHFLQHWLWPDGNTVVVQTGLLLATGVVIALVTRWLGPGGDVELLVDNIHVLGGASTDRGDRALIPLSLLGISVGSTLGPEAPLVQTCGTMGTWVARRLRLPQPDVRVLTIVDTHSRYCPAADPRFTYRGEDVVQTLERVCARIGYPKTIRVDNGSEFISRDLDLWAYANDVTLDFSRPGKPTDNGFIEAFNSKFRAECLNAHWFLSLADAREKMEDWRQYYNEVRPHSAIGYNVPIALQNPGDAASPSP